MAPISTRDLSRLPPPGELERLMQSLAMLEAILASDWDGRFYSFYGDWGGGTRMGWRRNPPGRELFGLFMEGGCFIKGFDGEAAVANVDPGEFYRQVPETFSAGVGEVAFSPENVTFCCWRSPADAQWQRSIVPAYADRPDGSETLLRELDGDPDSYRRFLQARFGSAPDSAAIAAVYAHRPLTPQMADGLERIDDWGLLAAAAEEIGYPLG